jgi:two-component system nitrogen regulation response regulator GlnG
VAINCAALPEQLLESELFGYERGAFTGAQQSKVGQIELASNGVLFLDEITEMSLSAQAKFLRVLQEREFMRLGGTRQIKANVRVIAATHQDLAAKVADGSFRADLLHRLDVVRLQLPPLRARKADLAPLLARFLEQAAVALGSPVKRLRPDALRMLEAHDWPGNVRELENLGWRLAALAPADSVDAATLAAIWARDTAAATHDWTAPLAQAVELALARNDTDVHATLRTAFDKTLLETAVAASGGHRQRAAQRLGLGRNTLTRKLGATRTRKKPE